MTTFRRTVTHPVTAAIVAGIAMWLTRASFDVAGTAQVPVRVAMLPSLAELMGLVVMFLLVVAGMAASLRRSDRPDLSYWASVTDTVAPLLALGLLWLPYLPFLADWVPAVTLLAGPGRYLLWIVVIGQVLWAYGPQLTQRLGLSSPVIGTTKSAAVFACLSVFLSAPFLFNLRALPDVFREFVGAIRHFPASRFSDVPASVLAVLFDQEFGMLVYAPVLVLGFIGLVVMMRTPATRTVSFLLMLVSCGVIVVAASADPWWRRGFAPGRPLMLVLPLLVIPIASLYAALPRVSSSRAAARVLFLLTLGISLVVFLFEQEFPIAQDGTGSSSVLRWLSPTWQLWSELPTYVEGSPLTASIRVLIWLAGFMLLSWILLRRARSSAGDPALLVTTGIVAACIAIPAITSVAVSDAGSRFNVEGRGLIPLIETFDPVARPIALRYDPFSLAQADELPPLFALSAVPGQRTGRQPLRVVLNARFRLPAGSYDLDVEGSKLAGTVPDAAIFLQIGREGGALTSWPLTMTPGTHAHHRFELPLDAEFVAFRAAPSIEPTIASMRITPVSVIQARKRLPAPRVLSAAPFPTLSAFFHGGAFPEADGFWVQGRATTRVTLLKVRESDTAITLAIHSGARPNVVTLSTGEWSQQLQLVKGVTERVSVPSKSGDRFIPLNIKTEDGFVPAEIDRSRDRRLLGAWIAFIPDDAAGAP